ncbi:hypothetical protein QBC35DRAFT_493422 [Podospora australis]|uniref:Uncharacterized protein n=1 Tax=Podospora australis TaxID=1536484 RepID=A0AAN7AI04_9PEZI|nr:hypothetical protein QBC35DRAFT_493422 [Podospora australis]
MVRTRSGAVVAAQPLESKTVVRKNGKNNERNENGTPHSNTPRRQHETKAPSTSRSNKTPTVEPNTNTSKRKAATINELSSLETKRQKVSRGDQDESTQLPPNLVDVVNGFSRKSKNTPRKETTLAVMLPTSRSRRQSEMPLTHPRSSLPRNLVIEETPEPPPLNSHLSALQQELNRHQAALEHQDEDDDGVQSAAEGPSGDQEEGGQSQSRSEGSPELGSSPVQRRPKPRFFQHQDDEFSALIPTPARTSAKKPQPARRAYHEDIRPSIERLNYEESGESGDEDGSESDDQEEEEEQPPRPPPRSPSFQGAPSVAVPILPVEEYKTLGNVTSDNLDELRDMMATRGWTGLGRRWEKDLARSRAATVTGRQCVKSVRKLNKLWEEVRAGHDDGERAWLLSRKQAEINGALADVEADIRVVCSASRVERPTEELGQDLYKLLIPVLILSLRKAFLLGTTSVTEQRGFTWVTIQYLLQITGWVSRLQRSLATIIEKGMIAEAHSIILNYELVIQHLEAWKDDIMKVVDDYNEKLDRAEKIAKDRRIKEEKRTRQQEELEESNRRWQAMADHIKNMKQLPPPMAQKWVTATQGWSPRQRSQPEPTDKPYSSQISVTPARPASRGSVFPGPPSRVSAPTTLNPANRSFKIPALPTRRVSQPAGSPRPVNYTLKAPAHPARQVSNPTPSRPQKQPIVALVQKPSPARVWQPPERLVSPSWPLDDDEDEDNNHNAEEEEEDEEDDDDDEEDAFETAWDQEETQYLLKMCKETEVPTKHDLEKWAQVLQREKGEILRQRRGFIKQGLLSNF